MGHLPVYSLLKTGTLKEAESGLPGPLKPPECLRSVSPTYSRAQMLLSKATLVSLTILTITAKTHAKVLFKFSEMSQRWQFHCTGKVRR